MERNLSQKELSFLKELEALLLRSGAGITELMGKVTFFIDNFKEGDCVPTENYLDAETLSHIVEEGKVRLHSSSDAENLKHTVNAKMKEVELCKESQDLLHAFSQRTPLHPFATSIIESSKLQDALGRELKPEDLFSGRFGFVDSCKPVIVSLPIEIYYELGRKIGNIQDDELQISILSMLAQGIIHQ